jgi:hypothetical protein
MNKYINAEKLVEILKGIMVFGADRILDFNDGIDYVTDLIDEMPSADVVEVKHGEWRPERTRFGFYCNNCKMYSYWSTNFCPNCGADMRERKETE